ncbi:hypothetical protein MXMO3_01832 [Maritalea myrionectae]|uniref:Uncharacterized protein n=1 Tax=Maritalea myrionectae TaxID=454601 RepID=A0A2R4ME91_9HYPH|nr:sialidase family protein [Maritalea myrionectae]AVX04357.1 hypothetical protein MXMO3_01832 [Maritalea myrionectae]
MALARFEHDFTDDEGNLIAVAGTVTVRREDTGELAIPYSDRDGTTGLGNPFAVSDGQVAFHVIGGSYKITLTYGAETRELRYQAIGTAAEQDAEALGKAGYAFEFEAETTSPPSASSIRANNADLSAATKLYIDDETLGESDISASLLALDPGGNLAKNRIRLTVGAVDAVFDVDVATDQTTYVELDVSNHDGSTSLNVGTCRVNVEWAGQDISDAAIFEKVRSVPWGQIPFGSSTPESGAGIYTYAHFPVLACGRNILGVLYKYGNQHDSASHEGVSASQQPAAGGTQNLTIEGTYASGGVATPPAATEVEVISDADDSARTFTVYGTVGGSADSEAISGPTAGVSGVATTKVFEDVTQVTVDGDTAGNVKVGFKLVPQNVSYRYSTDGGQSWSAKIDIFDGIGAGDTVYYWPALGTLQDLSFIALCSKQVIGSGTWTPVMRKSYDGITWDADDTTITITGDVPGVVEFFGKVQRTPSGRLVVGAYDGDESFVMYSDDDGDNWVSKLIVNDGATLYSEVTVAIIDELNWIAMVRIDNVTGSMLQLKTVDGGANWTNQGQTNLTVSGGYKSHDLTTVFVGGKAYIALVYMARETVSDPAPNLNTMCFRFARADDAISAATNWSHEKVLVDSTEMLSGYSAPGGEKSLAGYPSVWVNPESGLALLAYGRETLYYYQAQVETKKVDISSEIARYTRKPFSILRIEDDEFATTIPLPINSGGTGFLMAGGIGRWIHFAWETTGTAEIVSIEEGAAGSSMTTTTGTPDGTTGTDGQITLFLDTSTRKLAVENRLGSAIFANLEVSIDES